MSTYIERLSLAGKRALVTGGSKGIGAVTAEVLAEAGADVAVLGRDRAGLAQTQSQVRSKGRECLVIQADLRDAVQARRAAQQVLEDFGVVDILVNNAGVALVASLLEMSQSEWDETLAVNLTAAFVVSQVLAPKMIEQGRGKVINVSSQAGVVAIAGHGAYAASKGGLNMLTKVMAAEWGPYNIQCNAVAPTVIATPMGDRIWGDPANAMPMLEKIPLRRFGQPVEVADLILFLASSAADLITGETILIDGGYTAQ